MVRCQEDARMRRLVQHGAIRSRLTRVVLPILLALPVATATAQEPAGEWRYFGGDEAFTRYAPLDQIDERNVHGLEIAWRRSALDPELGRVFPGLRPSAYLKSTPVFIDGVLYAPNALGLLEAFDPATGETIWRQRPVVATMEEVAGASTRGAAYWSDGGDERLLLVRGEYLYALDRATGQRIPGFGLADRDASLCIGIDRSPRSSAGRAGRSWWAM